MSNYTYPSETFFEFKKNYIDLFGNSDSSWSLGKSFITRFVPQVDGWFFSDGQLSELWDCEGSKEAEDLIFKWIYDNTWDFLSLKPVKDVY